MPGPFDYERGISYIKDLDKYESLYGLNIKGYFADLFDIRPDAVRFRNDAESAIAGEILAGAGRGYQTIMGITLGTGFGSAISIDQITTDLNLGSEPFMSSIADDHLSTRWFLKTYFEKTGIAVTGVKDIALIAGHDLAARDIFQDFASNLCDF